MSFSSKTRKQTLQEMSEITLDVLVIGGGITGAGIALDAQTRGLQTGLVEMQDFAAGTSSRSTKLIHGGLRYLKQLEIKLVSEVGKERGIVYENGPHVTTPMSMLLPIYQEGTFGYWSTSLGLQFYDYLAGVSKAERRAMLTAKETKRLEPLIRKKGLKGGGKYVEYRTDDARLTVEVIKEAVTNGAKAVNYAKVTELLYEKDKVIGAAVEDQESGVCFHLYAKKVINATGPWVGVLREEDNYRVGKQLQFTKGVHLVFDQQKFPLKQAVYFDTPDGRMVFAIPRDGKTYVGTTDTFFEGKLSDPKVTVGDRAYLLEAIEEMFPSLVINEEDIESSWAGVRPLIYEMGKRESIISRKDEIWESSTGLITIAGGKLTGYRKMAEDVVDRLTNYFSKELKPCQTEYLPISGGHVGGSTRFRAFIEKKQKEALELGFTEEEYNILIQRYGSNIDHLYMVANSYNPECGLPLFLYTQLVYGIEEEMVTKPVDFFIRRTGSLFFNIQWVLEWKEAVNSFMAETLKWTEEELAAYKKELDVQLSDAITPTEDEI